MGACRVNVKVYCFFSELPLHEGRRNRVDPSGGVNLLAATERDEMGCLFNSHRVRPGHSALFVSVKKSQFFSSSSKMEITRSNSISKTWAIISGDIGLAIRGSSRTT